MAESDFSKEILSDFRVIEYHTVLLRDEIGQNLGFGGKARGKKKPYDCVVGMREHTHAGRALAIEFKQVRKGLSFPFSVVSDHQEIGMQAANDVGWASGVAVNFRLRLTSSEKRTLKHNDHVMDEAFYFPFRWMEWVKRNRALDSISLDEHWLRPEREGRPSVAMFRIDPGPDELNWNVEQLYHLAYVMHYADMDAFPKL